MTRLAAVRRILSAARLVHSPDCRDRSRKSSPRPRQGEGEFSFVRYSQQTKASSPDFTAQVSMLLYSRSTFASVRDRRAKTASDAGCHGAAQRPLSRVSMRWGADPCGRSIDEDSVSSLVLWLRYGDYVHARL